MGSLNKTTAQVNAALDAAIVYRLGYALSDQSTDITTGVKLTDRVTEAFILDSVVGSLAVAATGALFTVNIKKNGATIFSTKPTFNSGSATTVGATTPSVLSVAAFAVGDILEFSVDLVGVTVAGKGLIIKLIGHK